MSRIYISGKITGLDINEARQNFDNAQHLFEAKGYQVINPMKEVPYNPSFQWGDYMRADIKLLMDCDAIYMLPNWDDSDGAKVEHYLAEQLNMEIIYSNSCQYAGNSY